MTYTATVRIDRAWLTLATDPATHPLIVGTRRPSDGTDVQDGEVRVYVGGRRQSVTYAPIARTVPLTLVGLSPDDLALVKARRGLAVLFRSVIGERFYAVYRSVATHPMQAGVSLNDGRGYDVTITLEEIDYPEAVDDS